MIKIDTQENVKSKTNKEENGVAQTVKDTSNLSIETNAASTHGTGIKVGSKNAEYSTDTKQNEVGRVQYDINAKLPTAL
eukprot:2508578-Amphidinium_carterae.1